MSKRYYSKETPIVLSRADFDRFIETCNNPTLPSEALRELFRDYGRFVDFSGIKKREAGK